MVFLGRPSTTLRADGGDIDSTPVENRRRSNPPSLGSCRRPDLPTAGSRRLPDTVCRKAPASDDYDLSRTLVSAFPGMISPCVSRLNAGELSQATTATSHSPVVTPVPASTRSVWPRGVKDEPADRSHRLSSNKTDPVLQRHGHIRTLVAISYEKGIRCWAANGQH
ncbi:hypothetical protein THAOC_36621 [Thalassiosira oceanica]|uniref:Uncharacterized protein n=1 Tax=Thalassiosira oceanica TaxID=159749 RepID=K0R1L2_THAOC|nr:hypothetical protein THAOC_36621 [Thalassiosira oceanica]|eukprot:EJK44809.1 hypothetical protein THAOC_36621 [Thalassiosira oceanica]